MPKCETCQHYNPGVTIRYPGPAWNRSREQVEVVERPSCKLGRDINAGGCDGTIASTGQKPPTVYADKANRIIDLAATIKARGGN